MNFEELIEKRKQYLKSEIVKRLINIQKQYSTLDFSNKKDVQKILLERKRETLKKDLRWYVDHESFAISKISNPVDWNNFQPELVQVTSGEDKALYKYFRGMVASLADSGYVGRQIKFLLKDKVSTNVLGFASIGSDLCIIGERDKLIGWTHEQKFAKHKLGCGFNINVCMVLQPYGQLTTGKLLAMILCSDEVRALWKETYNDPCCYVLTTSLYGKSSQYNRIKKYLDFIGYTKGFGHAHIDKSTYALINEFLTLEDKNIADSIKRRSNAKMSIIGKGTKLAVDKHQNLGVLESQMPELKDIAKHGQKRGIYMGFFAENAKEFLTEQVEEKDIKWYNRPIGEIVEFWKKRWYSMRLPKFRDKLDLNPEQYKVENVLQEKLKIDKQLELF